MHPPSPSAQFYPAGGGSQAQSAQAKITAITLRNIFAFQFFPFPLKAGDKAIFSESRAFCAEGAVAKGDLLEIKGR